MYDVIFSYPDYSLIWHYHADPWDKGIRIIEVVL